MTDEIPIGPIIGVAVGLGILGATVAISKSILDRSKEDSQSRPRKRMVVKAPSMGRFDAENSVKRMIGE